MPLYTYEHPETGETIDLLQSMKDEHVYVDKEGVKWNRVFYSPEAAIDSSIDPFSNQAFVEKTGNSKGTVGELMDRSNEMSQRRTDKLGYDPMRQKYFKEYSKKRNGIKHRLDKS